MKKKQKKILCRIITASMLTLLINILPLSPTLNAVLSLTTYLLIGYDILLKAARGILNGRILDENFLMAVATVGAVVLAVYTNSGDYFEAIAVMLFYQIGEFFQSYAVDKSRKNISALMDIRPDYANIEADGALKRIDPNDVPVGTEITVLPGERIPLDGIVISGRSTVNTCALTGESLPRNVALGDEVISGCINMTGLIKVRTAKDFSRSTVSRILELVEESSIRKSRSENFISKFAKIYTPAVCIAALLLAVIPPIADLLLGSSADVSVWIYRALTFLVISCPCALVISVPLTFFAGIGGASRRGILIKGANYIETLSKAKTVVFDKTGTLTQGVFKVNEIHAVGIESSELLHYAAHAESSSTHPISKSILQAYGCDVSVSSVCDIEELGGMGVTANVDSHTVFIGNDKLMSERNIPYISCERPGTVVHIAIDSVYRGYIVISDVEKKTSKQAVRSLRALGIKKTVMLTGDSSSEAEKVSNSLGIDEFHSQLLPGDKVDRVEKLTAQNGKSGSLVFVGDGINDAPVLSRADIGIAMGGIGSDAAIEAADVVLTDDDPMKISLAIRISKKCIRIVYENIVFSLAVKFICLVLCAIGIADMGTAVFADVGVMIIAVLNAVRALR